MELKIGTKVFNSSVGGGELTGFTDRGYPKVNHVAVGRLVVKDEHNKFHLFDKGTKPRTKCGVYPETLCNF